MIERIQDPGYARLVLNAFNDYARRAPSAPSVPSVPKSVASPTVAALVPDEARFYDSDAGRDVAVGLQAVLDLLERVRGQHHTGSLSYADAEQLVRNAAEKAMKDPAAPLVLDAYVGNGTPELIADFIAAPGAGAAELATHVPKVGPAFGLVKQGVLVGGSVAKSVAKVVPVPPAVVESLTVAGQLSSAATIGMQFAAVGGVSEYARAIRVASAGAKVNDLRNFVDAKVTQCACCANNVKAVLDASETALAKTAAKANPVVSVAITAHSAFEHGSYLVKKLTSTPEPSIREGVLDELLTAARDTNGTSVDHKAGNARRCRVALEALVLLAAQKESSIKDVVVKVSAMMLASNTADAVSANKGWLPFMGGEKGQTERRHELTHL